MPMASPDAGAVAHDGGLAPAEVTQIKDVVLLRYALSDSYTEY
jgi:hypothetical protein